MATKADDLLETTLSTVDKGFLNVQETNDKGSGDEAPMNVHVPVISSSSSDEIKCTADDDTDTPIQPASNRNSSRTRTYSTYKLDCIAQVEAGPLGKQTAARKFMKSHEKTPTSKFIIVVNNMTEHDLVRSASSGSDSWPFSFVQKNECVAALYDHSQFKNLNVVFTADDDQPGIRTVMLYAHWTERGRGIGIYAGMTQSNSVKLNWQKIHDHKLDGNQAAITNPGSYYVLGYDIKKLKYAQFGITAGNEAATVAIERFTTFCTGSMPRFTFIVNNLTGYDLALVEKHEIQGSWPLDTIKRGECAVAGFNQLNMSLAVHYSTCVNQEEKSISLAGSWPVIGSRKILRW